MPCRFRGGDDNASLNLRSASVTPAAEAARQASLMRRVIDRVAGGADGAYDVDIAKRVQCFAQAAYVDVDSARLDINVVAPHRVEQLLAGKHPPGISQEVTQ